MMQRFIILCAAVLLFDGTAWSLPISTLENSYLFLARKAVVCMRPVPSQANPIRGRGAISELREQGRLLDSFKCGRCRYDLVEDADAAYYGKTCGALTFE